MLRNYLKIAYRNLKRRPGYTLINVGGLAVGMAACLLIALFVRDELSYDDFHENADRIYRLNKVTERGNRTRESLHMPAPMAPSLVREQPAVESAVRLYQLYRARVERGGETFYESGFFVVDSTFFEVFGFPLMQGDPSTALKAPYNVVISQKMAEKHFGGENPLGQTITLKADEYYTGERTSYTVTGVTRVPQNSHLQFDFLISFATLRTSIANDQKENPWSYNAYYTYLLLDEEADPSEIDIPEAALENARLDYVLQPIERIHLHSNTNDELQPGGDPRYLYIFAAVALLILGVACVNYTNLATARSARRAREVGVRKTVGATRGSLAGQFLGEALVFSFLALVVALGLTRLALPFFDDLLGRPLSFSYARDGGMLAALAAAGLAVGLVSGSYPALFLSRFHPTEVLRGDFRLGRRGALLRGGLLVFQFGVSVALVAGTVVIGQQLDHVRSRRLGLDAERVVTVHARDALDNSYDAFKSELLQQPGVEHVSAASQELPFPVDRNMATGLAPEGVDTGNERGIMDVNTLMVAPDFTETMGISLARGRDFTSGDRSEREDGRRPVLINEAAAEAFGWEEPVGKTFTEDGDQMPVIGVVKNFNYQSLKTKIEPLVLMPYMYREDHVMVRVQPGSLPQTLEKIQATWGQFSDASFDYGFLDRRFDQLYRADERLATLIGGFSLLAVLVACLGLFGLAAYATERRRKEIGIRKAMGASARNIVQLLAKDFLGYVMLGFAAAVPVAWYAMRWWLRDFAYRIDLGAGPFAIAGALVLAVALATVSYHALRAAWANPADALRYE
jgi:putative ABC transport system permease protein